MKKVVIVGAGFTGLAAALQLARAGCQVTVLERDTLPGGLAGSFMTSTGHRLEKFYHHWFTNDLYVRELIRLIGRDNDVLEHETRTGMFYANQFLKLSSPMDLLRFKPLSFLNRIRLGLCAIRARKVQDWRELENVTACEWLLSMCGEQVFRVVWEPLLNGKFGDAASEVSAVWFWNKLKLRGGSRGKGAKEVLAYYKGGFAALVDQIVAEIERLGGSVQCGTPVTRMVVEDGRVRGVEAMGKFIEADDVVLTAPLPLSAGLLEEHVSREYAQSLTRIRYLANVCIVLELSESLSSMYWLNVNDPSFPFVGVIEHTNFESRETYGGRHIVYLSKYLPTTAELWKMTDEEAVQFSLAALKRMFPGFRDEVIKATHVWRANYSQPIVERNYSQMLPAMETPIEGAYLATMAQIYPEDRGTNYAIRSGFEVASRILQPTRAGSECRRELHLVARP